MGPPGGCRAHLLCWGHNVLSTVYLRGEEWRQKSRDHWDWRTRTDGGTTCEGNGKHGDCNLDFAEQGGRSQRDRGRQFCCFDFCAEHNIVPTIKKVTVKDIEGVYKQLSAKNDAIIRNVLDIEASK